MDLEDGLWCMWTLGIIWTLGKISNVVVVDTEIFRYTPVGNEIFRYYNFSTHRCTLNYFSTAVSVHTGTHWNISVLQILYIVGILSFICELIHASYGLTLYMSLGQFHVYLLLKLLSCHETQDKSLTQACKDAISMLLIWICMFSPSVVSELELSIFSWWYPWI